MQINYIIPSLFVIGATLIGCSTMPQKNSVLEEARVEYRAAQVDPDVNKHAAVELQQAAQALKTADDAWRKREDAELVRHLAYLAKQNALIAQDTGSLRTAELAIVDAGARRDAVRLEVRTAEADAAHEQVVSAQHAADRQAIATSAADARRDREQLRQAEMTSAAAAQSSAELDAANMRVSEMEKELAALNARKTERGRVITLGDVLFDFNKSELKPGSERDVQKIADFLNQYPERKALVEGFTDNTGSASYNQMLSERRADAVRMFLIQKGVNPRRVTIRGYGESNPVASNDTAVTRQLNRRVEIIVSEGDNDIQPR